MKFVEWTRSPEICRERIRKAPSARAAAAGERMRRRERRERRRTVAEGERMAAAEDGSCGCGWIAPAVDFGRMRFADDDGDALRLPVSVARSPCLAVDALHRCLIMLCDSPIF